MKKPIAKSPTLHELHQQQLASVKRFDDFTPRRLLALERRRRASETPVKLAKTDQLLQIKEEELVMLRQRADTEQAERQQSMAQIEHAVAMRLAEAAQLSAEIAAAQYRLDCIEKTAATVSKTKKSIITEIAEARRYLAEQQDLIAQTIEDGNMQLKSLQYAVAEVERSKTDMQNELAQLDQKRSDMVLEIVSAEVRLDEVKAESKQTTDNTATQLRAMKTAKAELDATHGAIERERIDLATEKRRWASTKKLYNI